MRAFFYPAMILVLMSSASAMDEKEGPPNKERALLERQDTVRIYSKVSPSGPFDSSSDAKSELFSTRAGRKEGDVRKAWDEKHSDTKGEYISQKALSRAESKESAGMKKAGGGTLDVMANFTENMRMQFHKSFQTYRDSGFPILPLLSEADLFELMVEEFQSGGLWPHEFIEIGIYYPIESVSLPYDDKIETDPMLEQNAAQLAIVFTLSNLKKLNALTQPIGEILEVLNSTVECSPNAVVADLYYALQLNGLSGDFTFADIYRYYPSAIEVLHNEFPPEARMPVARFCLSLIDTRAFSADALVEFLLALKPSNPDQWLDKFQCMSHEANKEAYGRLCDMFSLVSPYFQEEDYYELYRLSPTLYPDNANSDQKLTAISDLVEKTRASFIGHDAAFAHDTSHDAYWYWHIERDLQRLTVLRTPSGVKYRLKLLLEAREPAARRESVMQASVLINKGFVKDFESASAKQKAKSIQPCAVLIALFDMMDGKVGHDQARKDVSSWDTVLATKRIISNYTCDVDTAFLLRIIAEVPVEERATFTGALEEFTNSRTDLSDASSLDLCRVDAEKHDALITLLNEVRAQKFG